MPVIEHVEILQVDLAPKVVRTDAIQSFVAQETPIVRVTCDDGAHGMGYSYTIGTGGSSVVALIADHLAHIVKVAADLGDHTPVRQQARQPVIAILRRSPSIQADAQATAQKGGGSQHRRECTELESRKQVNFHI